MKVKQLRLQNYGRFEDLTIDFAPTKERSGNVTVIVGNNGAGKSQILRSLHIAVAQFIFECYKVNFLEKDDNDIPQNQILSLFDTSMINVFDFKNIDDAVMRIDLLLEEKIFTPDNIVEKYKKIDEVRYFLHRDNKFTKPSISGDSIFFTEIIESYKKDSLINGFLKLPIILFYSTERSFLNISKINILDDMKANQMNGYDNSSNAGIDFDSFTKWFKYREDFENSKLRLKFDKILEKIKSNDISSGREDLEHLISQDIIRDDVQTDNQLYCVKYAIKNFMDDIDDIYVNRNYDFITLTIVKNGEKLDVNQLSQGEKSLLALVGDIARRLAILNPSLDDPLQGEGVVMIDEVDLHLHPKWQHNLIDKLVRTFPNVQFILTTHSPLIISDRQDILVYILDNGELQMVGNIYGEDANTLLNEVFDVSSRTPEIEKAFNDIRRAISNKELANAENLINDIAQKVASNNTELLKVKLMLAQAKLAEHKMS